MFGTFTNLLLVPASVDFTLMRSSVAGFPACVDGVCSINAAPSRSLSSIAAASRASTTSKIVSAAMAVRVGVRFSGLRFLFSASLSAAPSAAGGTRIVSPPGPISTSNLVEPARAPATSLESPFT